MNKFGVNTAVVAVLLILAVLPSSKLFGQQLRNANAASGQPQISQPADSGSRTEIVHSLLSSPMSFEANQGQTDSRVKFLSRGAGYTLFLTGDEAVLALQKSAAGNADLRPAAMLPMPGMSSAEQAQTSAAGSESSILTMRLAGANRLSEISGLDETVSKSNYFIGNDPHKWRTNVARFARVRYASVYPGVDMIYYGNQRQLEYDLVVSPGADPRNIALKFTTYPHAASLRIDENGDLIAHLDGGDVRFHKPIAYQTDAQSQRKLVDVSYALKNEQVSFNLGAYDRSRQLVIDPVLQYATYLGGSDEDAAFGVATDKFGDALVIGSTRSTDFPLQGQLQTYHPGACGNQACRDVFITKFSPSLRAELYSSYYGGSGDDVGTSIVFDSMGDIFAAGWTTSADFPTKNAYQSSLKGGSDGFVFELASLGTFIEYSTYLGGSGNDQINSLVLDSNLNAYVVGYTESTDFPTTRGIRRCGLTKSNTCATGFATKVNPQGTGLVYSSYLGGSNGLGDAAYADAVDPNGNLYIVGITGSPNFPITPGAYDTHCGTDSKCDGTFDGFVTKVNATASGLAFSTFLGGSGFDYLSGVTIYQFGSVFVSGNTASTDFPTTTGAAQTTFGGMSNGCVPSTQTNCGDVTISKLAGKGNALEYSTYLGGSGDEYPGSSIAIDGGGNAYVTGQTSSTNFPLAGAFQGTYGGGGSDAFVTQLNATGTKFTYSSYLGGSGADFGYHVSVDPFGQLMVVGGTVSTNFPATHGAFQTQCGTDGTCNGGLSDAWVARVTLSADLGVTNTAPGTVQSGAPLTYTIQLTNAGPDSGTIVTMTDDTPTGTTFQSVSTSAGTCTGPQQGGTGTVMCTINSQPKGAKVNISMVVNVTAGSGSTITDTAKVGGSGSDPNKNNNSAIATTQVQ